MRNSSSRQLVGCEGAALKISLPGTPALGSGIIPRKAPAAGSTGTWLFRNGACVDGSIGQSINEPLVGLGQTSLKLPPRSATDGTGWLKVCPGTRSRRHSCDQKKNVFCLSVLYTPGMYTGPPMV